MAKVLDPLGARSAHGKIGGIVFTKGFAGNSARRFSQPSRTPTDAQTEIRNAFQFCISAYLALPVDAILAWTEIARTNLLQVSGASPHRACGQVEFIRQNFHRRRLRRPPIYFPLRNRIPDWMGNVDLTRTVIGLQATAQPLPTGNQRYLLALAPPTTLSRNTPPTTFPPGTYYGPDDAWPVLLAANQDLRPDSCRYWYRWTPIDENGFPTVPQTNSLDIIVT